MERRTFTREFKVEAVKLIQERGVTVAYAARDLGVHGTVLRRWVQESATDAAQAFPGQGQMKSEQAELARLRHEVLKLKAERDILKKSAGSSTGRCNTSLESIHRGFISQYLSGPLIQLLRNPVELGLRMCREIRALREVLPQQAVRIFVGAPLPGALRVTEIDRHLGIDRQWFVLR